MSRAEDHSKRSLPSESLSTGGAWRYAPLQAVRIFEQSTSKEKATHGEGHMSLTKVGNSSGPSSIESGRQMPVSNGERALQTCKDQQCFRSGNGG